MKTLSESIIGKRGNIHKFDIDDLRDEDIVILRCGEAMIVRGEMIRMRNPGGRSVYSIPIKNEVHLDLTSKFDPDRDIMKVYRVKRDLEPPLLDFDYFSFELLNLIDDIQHGKFKETKIYLMFERK